jgi:hypothetical protein
MAFEVEIFNYKTIKHVKYTIDGYTLLIGKNFIGKSAAIQAIVAAFKNAEGEGFIRRGEKFCEVRIHHNGDSVIWHKEKGNNFYVINYQGKLYDLKKSLGRGEVPQPVISMGFGPLLISGEKAYLWYAKQFETLFLVDKPRQNFTTDLIASVADLDAIYKATDMVKKELSAKKSDLKLRATDLKDAREQAKEYSALDQYESGEAAIQALVDSIGLLGREIESLGSIEREFEQGLAVAQKLSPASSLEVLSTTSLDSLYLEINTLYRIHKEFLEASAQEAMYLPITVWSLPWKVPLRRYPRSPRWKQSLSQQKRPLVDWAVLKRLRTYSLPFQPYKMPWDPLPRYLLWKKNTGNPWPVLQDTVPLRKASRP